MISSPDEFCLKVCVTGQHRQMLDQVLSVFNIAPDYDLNIMASNQTLIGVTSAIMARLEPIISAEKPDWILVQGDTSTVAAASMAAFYSHAKVGHVEAGLRTWDKQQPFPEEINRRIATVIADLHFAPTQTARQNLLRENIPDIDIVVTGNPVIDALHMILGVPFVEPNFYSNLVKEDRKIILVEAHRRENFGQPMVNICLGLREIAEQFRDEIVIVYPVHLNPNVHEPVYDLLGNTPNIMLTDPLDYLVFSHLMQISYIVVTDSGGIQEEAPGLGKPVLVLRNVTERPEAVEAGTVKLVGTERDRIYSEVKRLLTDDYAYNEMACAVNPYGDGHAAERIKQAILDRG